jgi:hypothetical protein
MTTTPQPSRYELFDRVAPTKRPLGLAQDFVPATQPYIYPWLLTLVCIPRVLECCFSSSMNLPMTATLVEHSEYLRDFGMGGTFLGFHGLCTPPTVNHDSSDPEFVESVDEQWYTNQTFAWQHRCAQVGAGQWTFALLVCDGYGNAVP